MTYRRHSKDADAGFTVIKYIDMYSATLISKGEEPSAITEVLLYFIKVFQLSNTIYLFFPQITKMNKTISQNHTEIFVSDWAKYTIWML